jgi:hypothetical protein
LSLSIVSDKLVPRSARELSLLRYGIARIRSDASPVASILIERVLMSFAAAQDRLDWRVNRCSGINGIKANSKRDAAVTE